MEQLFKSKMSWNDSVMSLHRAIWTGDHDSDIMKLAAVIPAALDNQAVVVQKRLCELVPPFRPLILAQQAESQKMLTEVEQKLEQYKQKKEELEKDEESNSLATKANVTLDGDAADDIFRSWMRHPRKRCVFN